jgi:hypothetical protein
MRFAVAILALVLAGCFGALDRSATAEDDGQGNGSGSGSGAGGAFRECQAANDCVAAGPKCCDCPTHAVPVDDPAQAACANVDCPTPSCGSPMEAACDDAGKCVLVCSAEACPASLSCGDGFATDANGCLICSCAAPTATECSVDGDCVRTRADCCGCMLGGYDTALPASQLAGYEAQLMCSANPSCPSVNTCAPDLSARCIAGECTLVSGALPPNACGRPDLPACPQGEACTVNANDQATMQGVGVCQPAP